MSKFCSKSAESPGVSDSYVKLLISDSSKANEELFDPLLRRLLSAVFYGVSSFLIIVVNKILLTTYK